MRTAFLGSYGFGNLGDELCLLEAMQRFPSDDAWVFSVRPEFTGRFVQPSGWFEFREELVRIQPDRIILGGGGVGFWPSLRDSLHWMHDHLDRGAECHIHNIGVGNIDHPDWFTDDIVREVLGSCASVSVRDHIARWLVTEWGFGLSPPISFYPEALLPPDDALCAHLPDGPLLGISITGQGGMTHALERNQSRVRAALEPFRHHRIVPINSVNHPWEPDEDDIAGFERFAAMFLDGFELALPKMLDRTWWAERLTPLRLKGLIGRCDHLLTQRKHNAIHAIGCGVPFTGIHPAADDNLARILYSLRDRVPPTSSLLPLN